MRKLKLFMTALALVGGVNFALAQTDVTSSYITNADFEGEYTVFSNPRNDGNNARAIYQPTGWTVTYTDRNENDMSCLNSSCLQWSQFSEQKQPSNGGNNTYWTRLRFGGNTKLVLSQTASVPAGTYSLSADAYKNSSNGVATISAAGKSVTIDGRSEWSNYTIVFTLTETTLVTFSYSFEGKATDTRIGIDNFKLVDITQGTSDITAQDWTSMIANAGFEKGSGSHSDNSITTPYGYTFSNAVEGWQDGKIVTDDKTEGNNAYNLWAGNVKSADMYQNLTLPVGKYTISADFKSDNLVGAHGVYAKIGDDTFKSSGLTQSGSWETLSKDFYVTEAGTVRLGASSTAWFKIDNFQLSYKGAIQNTINSITPATATAITNDKWYAVDISADGDYRIISTVANTVTYTQDGYKVPSDISTSVDLTAGVKQVVALTRGTLYVKASTDAELTIEPDVYTYSVGDATKSVADNEYTQSNTITFTFADASTNDPDGALSILDESKIKVNDVAASASIEGNVLTVTLASPLATSTDYAVSIEAGAVGYNAENANAAISLTAKTPALFDGTFFISDGTKYISRGGDSNTEAVLDKYGIAATFTTNAANVTTIVFADNDKNFFGGSEAIYTDKNYSDLEKEGEGKGQRIYWTLTKVGDEYKFYNNNSSKFIKYGTSTQGTKAYAAIYAEDEEDATTWVLETPAAHQIKMAAYKDANAAAVATAAGLSQTTVAALETELRGSNWTSNNVAPTNSYSSVTEKYQPNGYGENIFTQNLRGLNNGIYKVTLSIFHRIRDYATTYTLHQANADNPTAYLYANDQQVQLPSPLTEPSNDAYSSQDSELGGKHYPNGMTAAGEAFTAGKYNVTVYAVVTDGTLSIGVKDPGKYSNANWICWRDLAVTSYIFKGDYSSLATAIETVEGKLGFGNKEYSPYNNVANMAILNAAKALNSSQDAINQDEIDDAETDLTSASWNENNGDVDAIYNGMFATVAEGKNYPDGWTRTNGWGQMQSGLSGTYATAYYNQPGSLQYGNQGVYTMPLAANTAYALTFAYRSHENNSNKKMTVSVLKESDGLPAMTFAGNGSTTDWKVVTKNFKTGAAGNYILTLANDGNTWITNVSLVKAGSGDETIEISNAGFATYVSDVDLDFSSTTSIKAYTVKVSTKGIATLTKVDEVPAGTPVLLYADGGATEDIPVMTSAAAVGENDLVAGKGAAVATTEGDYTNMILNNGSDGIGFYFAAGQTVAANRAYLQILTTLAPDAANARGMRMVFADETQGISAVGASESKAEGYYNLSGQRVAQPTKGLYIVNGKKVIIK